MSQTPPPSPPPADVSEAIRRESAGQILARQLAITDAAARIYASMQTGGAVTAARRQEDMAAAYEAAEYFAKRSGLLEVTER